MPTYLKRCVDRTCKHEFEAFSPMRTAHLVTCEKCGGATLNVPVMVNITRTELHGKASQCREIRFAPKEVLEARKLWGRDGADCIKDDGTVRFGHKSEAGKFFRRDQELRAKFADKKAAREERRIAAGLPAPKPDYHTRTKVATASAKEARAAAKKAS